MDYGYKHRNRDAHKYLIDDLASSAESPNRPVALASAVQEPEAEAFSQSAFSEFQREETFVPNRSGDRPSPQSDHIEKAVKELRELNNLSQQSYQLQMLRQ